MLEQNMIDFLRDLANRIHMSNSDQVNPNDVHQLTEIANRLNGENVANSENIVSHKSVSHTEGKPHEPESKNKSTSVKTKHK